MTHADNLREMWKRYRDGIIIPERCWKREIVSAELLDSASSADPDMPEDSTGVIFSGKFRILGNITFSYHGSYPCLYIPATHLIQTRRKDEAGTILRILGRDPVDRFLAHEPRISDVMYVEGYFCEEESDLTHALKRWEFTRRGRGVPCRCLTSNHNDNATKREIERGD